MKSKAPRFTVRQMHIYGVRDERTLKTTFVDSLEKAEALAARRNGIRRPRSDGLNRAAIKEMEQEVVAEQKARRTGKR